MNLQAYLDRIGYWGAVHVNLETLTNLMRAHLNTIPFENIDVQLGRPLGTEITAIFDKIVARRRGGWCYEMNGVFGWALLEIGFDVTRLAGGVLRETAGDEQIGNHLCLLVALDRPYLADVGFGGGLAAPIPFHSAVHDQPPFTISLRETSDGYWRFSETAGEGHLSFDFREKPADDALLSAKCAFLQTDPSSPFVQNLVVQKREGNRHIVLRGRVLKEVSRYSADKRLILSANEFISVLNERFGIDEPEAASLWPQICGRHEELFPDESNSHR